MPKSLPANIPANAALDEAAAAFRMQRPDEAERIVCAVLKADRGNIRAAHILGRALLMQNRASEAVDHLKKAVRRSEDAALETSLARALAADGQTAEAFDQLARTTARRPPFVPAFLELADQHGKRGQLTESIAVLERGAALEPHNADLCLALGQLHLKQGARAKARALFEQVRAQAPDRLDATTLLARILMLDGEYAAAAGLYRRVLALNPDDAVTRVNLAKCLLEIGERDAGETTLRTATRGGSQLTGLAISTLAGTSHGRFFLKPSAAVKFLREKN